MALNNIGNMMKIMNAWNIFKRNHPKFPAFWRAVYKHGFKGGQHHGDHGYHTGWRKD